MPHKSPNQLAVIRNVMVRAQAANEWLTLGELHNLTLYPETSISAQLRHLRKPSHGAHVVTKRYIAGRGWEYQLDSK